MAFGDRKLGMFMGGKFGTCAVFEIDGFPVSVQGIFDDPGVDARMGQQEFSATEPFFTCSAADVAAVKDDMIVTINHRRYFVVDIKPDGTGMATVSLGVAPHGS